MKISYKGCLYEEFNMGNPLVGGIGDNFKDYDPEELGLGIRIEMEHIGNNPNMTDAQKRSIARDIALDHLKEIKDYYTRLVKMEKTAEKTQ